MTDFEESVKELTEWWDSGQGSTCEFSTSFENIQWKLEYVSKITPKKGIWIIRFCECCKSYNADKPLHVMIWPA